MRSALIPILVLAAMPSLAADDMPPPITDVVSIPRALLQRMSDDNKRIRAVAQQAFDERDEAQEEARKWRERGECT